MRSAAQPLHATSLWPRPRRHAAAALTIAAALLAGCAAPTAAPPQAALADRDCVRLTGSNVCRRAPEVAGSNVTIISGDAVRRAGAEIAKPDATKIEP